MKKVLLFSRDPGGANTVIPLYHPLKAKGYDIALWGKDTALDKYNEAGLPGMDIAGRLHMIDPVSIKGFLSAEAPDVVVTGTSAEDPCEKYIWKAAGELKIFSLAILDQWLNYGVRFSPYPCSQIDIFRQEKLFGVLPDKILLMDELARQEALADGLPAERLFVTGQPHLQAVASRPAPSVDQVARIRDSWRLAVNELAVVFASEPLTELAVLEDLVSSLDLVMTGSGKKVCVVVRPHPRENLDKFDQVSGLSPENARILVSREYASDEVIHASDLVCGMSSMFLLEAVLLGKPVVSIETGVQGKSLFMLDRSGVLESVRDKGGLARKIKDILVDKKYQPVCMPFVKDAAANVLAQIESGFKERQVV